MFRQFLRRFCADDMKCEVVAEASTAAEAEAVLGAHPDVIILDLQLPDGDGFQVFDAIRSSCPEAKVVVLSSYSDDYTIFRAARLGIHGFVDKHTDSTDTLARAISEAADGRRYLSPVFVDAIRAQNGTAFAFLRMLSDRECDVLGLIGHAFCNWEIADRLGISETTAQTHRSRIMRKLGIAGTPRLIQFAIEHGFTRPRSLRAGTRVVH